MTIKRKFLGLLKPTEPVGNPLQKVMKPQQGIITYDGIETNIKNEVHNLLSGESIPHDTICVNDISGSMSYADCKPSRLEASKIAAKKFVSKRAVISTSDRIAVVSFNTKARIVLPFTGVTELSSINSAIDSLKIWGGTDIDKGLKAAAEIFTDDPIANFAARRLKRILLLTDGCGGNPINISKALKDADVLIEAIGIGGDRSKVNEELLKKVATTDADGFTHYWFFTDTDSLIKQYENIATGLVWKGNNK